MLRLLQAVDNLSGTASPMDMTRNILDRRRFAMAAAALGCAPLWAGVLPRFALAQAESAGPKPVTSQTLFDAEAIPVDVTAGTVTEARERGLTQGRVAGFRKVIARIVARDDQARVPQVSAAEVIDLVREFSIANERSSAVRYLADLTVRFNPVAIRRLLRGANIPFTETLSKPLVVVPLMRTDPNGSWQLWEPTNAWKSAWASLPQDFGLVHLITPGGNSEDVAALSADQAAAKDLAALNALAQRYQAGGAVIVAATQTGGTIELSVSEVRSDLPSEEITLSQPAEAGKPQDDVLAAAGTAAVGVIQDSWKHRNRVAFGGTTQITALVPVVDLKDWLAVKNKLDDVPLIDRLELQAMTRDRAQVTLYYAGEQRQLELAMSQHDLTLTQQSGVWIIQTLEGARRAAAAQTATPAAEAPPPAGAPTAQ